MEEEYWIYTISLLSKHIKRVLEIQKEVPESIIWINGDNIYSAEVVLAIKGEYINGSEIRENEKYHQELIDISNDVDGTDLIYEKSVKKNEKAINYINKFIEMENELKNLY